MQSRLFQGIFRRNQPLDGSISFWPLHPLLTNDLHVSIATSHHQSFPWLYAVSLFLLFLYFFLTQSYGFKYGCFSFNLVFETVYIKMKIYCFKYGCFNFNLQHIKFMGCLMQIWLSFVVSFRSTECFDSLRQRLTFHAHRHKPMVQSARPVVAKRRKSGRANEC